MENRNVNVGGGITISGLLGIVFIVLKLCGVIDWPWVWVLAPFWISLSISILIIAICTVIVFILRGRYS